MRPPHPVAALLVTAALALALGACDDAPVELKFDPNNVDLTQHVFPTAQYQGDERIEVFSEAQLGELPFLRLLATTDGALYGSATAIRLAFTETPGDTERWLAPASLEGAIRIYRVGAGATPIPVGETHIDTGTNTVTVRPRRPFAPGTYGVVVLAGRISTRNGEAVTASEDYATVRSRGDNVTDASFAEVAQADADIIDRRDTLAYLQFTVGNHTRQLALLAAAVAGEIAVDRAGVDETLDVTPLFPAASREIAAGAAEVVASGPAAVALYFADAGRAGLDLSGVDRVVVGGVATPNFISDTEYDALALPTNGTFLGRNAGAAFGDGNPVSLSRAAPSRVVPYLALFPAPSAEPAPVVVAIHGVGRAKEDWLSVAPALCAAGHAVIAIDLYQHGARQADIAVPEGDFADKVDPVIAASRFPDPFINPTFLARTRDKLRQSVVDQLALIRLLAAADGTRPELDLDGDDQPDAFGPIRVVAHSLGAMLATSVIAVSPHVDRAALTAPGGSYVQVLADSPSFGRDVDLLIYATANAADFALMGAAGHVMLPGTGERQLYDRVAETVLSSADPMTFAPAVLSGALDNARPRLLVQLALGDSTVPNDANVRFVQAVAAGADSPPDFPQVTPVHFPLGIGEVDGAAGLPGSGVTQFVAGHNFIFDFVNPEVTAAAQAQLVAFLTAD